MVLVPVLFNAFVQIEKVGVTAGKIRKGLVQDFPFEIGDVCVSLCTSSECMKQEMGVGG